MNKENLNTYSPLFVGIAGPSGSGKTALANTLCRELNHNQAVPNEPRSKPYSLDRSGQPTESSAVDSDATGCATVISEDAYYRNQSAYTLAEREKLNYDHPDAFDYELLVDQLDTLKCGKPIASPIYNYSNHSRSEQTKTIIPAPIVFVEGILVFANEALVSRFDLKIFVDTPLDICLARRIRRDLKTRGRDLESVLDQYEQYVHPMC